MARQRKQDIKATDTHIMSVQVTGDILIALEKEAEKHPAPNGQPASRSSIVVLVLREWARSNGYKVK